MANLINIIWLAVPALQIALMIAVVRRGAHRFFPLFFGYTLFAIVTEFARFALRARPFPYFYVWWTSEALYSVLGYAVLYEVFDTLFRHLYYLRGFRLLFPGVSLFVLAFSGLRVFVVTPPVFARPLLAAVFALELAVRWLQTSLLVLIFCLAIYYVEYAQQRAFGIAAGFGVAAAGILGTILVRSEFGTRYALLLQFLGPVTYLIAVLIWLISFARPEPPDYLAPLRGLGPWRFTALAKEGKDRVREKLPRWLDDGSTASILVLV